MNSEEKVSLPWRHASSVASQALRTVFFSGAISIIFQCLLLREFVSSLEGNDIAISIFFCFWLLWSGCVSFMVGRTGLAEKISGLMEYLPLFFVPAFILQFVLLSFARQIFGSSQYETFPLFALFASSAIVNLPVSMIVGVIFPCACHRASTSGVSPALVYVSELSGSLMGGLFASCLLFAGYGMPFLFFISTGILLTAFVIAKFAGRGRKLPYTGVLFLAFLFFLVRPDERLDKAICRFKWGKTLPTDSFSGVFRTPYGEYLYGKYGGRINVFRDGAVYDIFPDAEGAGVKSAIAFSQNPDAERILLVGSGVELCRAFLKASKVKSVYFCGVDPDYHAELAKILSESKIADKRFHEIKCDIRSFLAGSEILFDIVFLDISPSASAFANRFSSKEFYSAVRKRMSPNGILTVSVRSGENALSPQNIFEGASCYKTLSLFFGEIVFIPGDDAWFVASVRRKLARLPDEARANFVSIKDAEEICPPDLLSTYYRPFMEEMALGKFKASLADTPVNSDSRPVSFLNGLLVFMRKSGFDAYRLFKRINALGCAVFAIPMLFFAFLFLLVKVFLGGRFPGRLFLSTAFMLFSGLPGMGTSVLLMYLFQCKYGLLLSTSGAISALFMFGMTIGGLFFASAIRRCLATAGALILPALIVSCSFILVASILVHVNTPVVLFLCVFTVGGFINGAYFPIASNLLWQRQDKIGEHAGLLAFADYAGAALSSALTGIILIPVLGTVATVAILAFGVCLLIPVILRPEHLSDFASLSSRASKISLAGVLLLLWILVCAFAVIVSMSYLKRLPL